MKSLTIWIHRVVRVLSLEPIIFYLMRVHPLFLKFIPLPHEYSSGKEVVVKRYGVFFKLDISDYMQWYIYSMQPDNSWKLARNRLSKSGAVLDIGANCGGFCLPLARWLYDQGSSTVVYAFEPNPLIFDRLAFNLDLNPELKERVVLQNIGLGEASASAYLKLTDGNSGAVNVSKNNQDGIRIKIDSLDNWVKVQKVVKIAFVKIDVEGYEPLVLKGGEQAFLRDCPDFYLEMTESWFQVHGFSQTDILKGLWERGYKIFMDSGSQLIPIPDEYQIPKVVQYNVLALYGE